MNPIDERMIYLIDTLISYKEYKSVRDFCISNEIETTRIDKIKKGKNYFTVSQIQKICTKHNVNFNWVFGVENNMFFNVKNRATIGFNAKGLTATQ